MTALLETKDTYRQAFEALAADFRADPPWLYEMRRRALDEFERRGFPTLKDEEWRFTNVAPIAQVPFVPAQRDRMAAFPDLDGLAEVARIVFVNGIHAPEWSAPAGLTLRSLRQVLRQAPETVQPYLTRQTDVRTNAFTALNTALFRDGACVLVDKGRVVEQPVHVVYLATAGAEPAVSQPRTLVVAGPNSQVTVVEWYLGAEDGVYFTNAVTEVVAGAGAVVEHYKVQQESRPAFHVAATHVLQERGSKGSFWSLALGGELARNEIKVLLDGEGSECNLHGLSLATGRQLLDDHTRIDHLRPHCYSRERYKAILDGQAHGVFNGKVYVHPDAQKTDARQSSQTLLLSKDAVINTKPQLEIFADDVKCTHGATVGQLDPEALFYLRSRGLGHDQARALLTYAFANEIVGQIRLTPLRERIEEALASFRQPPEHGEVT